MITLVPLFLWFGSVQSDGDEKVIRAARQASNEAIARHDIDGIGVHWTEDFHMITSRNAEGSGRLANMERMAADFKAKPDVIYVRMPDQVEIFESWKMAAETGKWKGSWTDRGQKIEIGGSYYAKWHRVGGRWLIRAEVFTPTWCKGGDYCSQAPF
ncbi:MAG: nuclear transport factor 2 family protein [Cyclobacteriaceae bacterium]